MEEIKKAVDIILNSKIKGLSIDINHEVKTVSVWHHINGKANKIAQSYYRDDLLNYRNDKLSIFKLSELSKQLNLYLLSCE